MSAFIRNIGQVSLAESVKLGSRLGRRRVGGKLFRNIGAPRGLIAGGLPPITLGTLVSVVDATNAAAYSGGVWNGVAIGTAADNRRVLACIRLGSAAPPPTVTSATFGGVGASLVFGVTCAGAAENRLEFWQANVPSGTTADFVWNLDKISLQAGMGVLPVYGAASAAADTGSSTANPMSDTLTFASGGMVFAVSENVNAGTHTWLNATERYDEAVEGSVMHSGASDAFAAAQTNLEIRCTSSAPQAQDLMACVAFVPG